MARRKHAPNRTPGTAGLAGVVLLLLMLAVAAERVGLGRRATSTSLPATLAANAATLAATAEPGTHAGANEHDTDTFPAANMVEAAVLDVVDGDTIRVDMSGQRYTVRYIGIDAPEVYPTLEPYGEAATVANRALVSGQVVYLEKDTSDADRYGRLLRYVWADGVMVNEQLLLQGLARAGSYPPDVRHTRRLLAAEAEARDAGLGLWRATTAATAQTLSGACGSGCMTPSAACLIKGNINARGDRYYHLPGSPSYDGTRIDPDKGERWFCSEAEAEAAGWSIAP